MRRSRIRENRGKTIRNSRAKPPITQIKRGHRPLRDCRQFIKVKLVIVFRFSKMRALKDVRIKFMDKEVSCTALFDTDSSITAIQRSFFERNFGTKWLRLYWINGELIVVDKHAQLSIVIDGFDLPETVFIIDDFVKEIMINDKRIKPPKLIVGSGTMDKYGITLDPKEDLKFTRAILML